MEVVIGKMSKMKEIPSYDKVLQELEKQYLVLMTKYLSKLHDAFHKDRGSEASHIELVNRIKQDCILMCSNSLARLTFDDRTEEEVIKEILEYNFDETDIKHMREVERIDLYPILYLLEKYCIKRSSPEWFQFGVHELMQSGKVDPGTVGVNRPQFCIYCGEEIFLPLGLNTHTSKHTKGTRIE